jgi:putative transposase
MRRTVRQECSKEKTASRADLGEAVEPVETRAAIIQALIPIVLEHVAERLAAEVIAAAGARYQRGDHAPSRVRWGSQAGSVYLGDQRVPIQVPRVRDRATNSEVPLPTYQALQQPRAEDRALLHAILGGLSTREYARCVRLVPEAFGLSASTTSRRFRQASRRALVALQERRLGGEPIVAVLLDGKTFAEDAMVIAIGVLATGEKRVLGVVQTATENRAVCAQFLRQLLDRGLDLTDGLLVVIDGSRGLAAAVHEVFGVHGVVQRCQWHKRENVVRYLPKSHQVRVRRQLQRAYDQPTYDRAKKALAHVRRELVLLNTSAAASLDEGLEETLTLHRLGCFRAVGASLKTTNVLESINARIASRTDKVDVWKNSAQKHRWLAAALLDLEPRLHRIKGFAALPQLRAALARELRQARKTAA